MEPILQIEDLSFAYRKNSHAIPETILNNISFRLKPKEILAIVGPNGAGKSTLIKIISRVLLPQTGRILLKGKDLRQINQKALARIVAVLPQETLSTFNYSVEEMVLMGRAPYKWGLGWETRRDYDILKKVQELAGIEKFSRRSFPELSSGEKKRVLIARALAQEADILLLDEPTANLDLKFQTTIFDLLTKLNREQGISIIVVSHDLNLTADYCQRLIMLKDGIIHKNGTPEEVITQETVANVFGANVTIGRNPATCAPHLYLQPG